MKVIPQFFEQGILIFFAVVFLVTFFWLVLGKYFFAGRGGDDVCLQNSSESVETYMTSSFQLTFASLPGCSAIVVELGAINDSFVALSSATWWPASSALEKVNGGGLISAIRTPTIGLDRDTLNGVILPLIMKDCRIHQLSPSCIIMSAYIFVSPLYERLMSIVAIATWLKWAGSLDVHATFVTMILFQVWLFMLAIRLVNDSQPITSDLYLRFNL